MKLKSSGSCDTMRSGLKTFALDLGKGGGSSLAVQGFEWSRKFALKNKLKTLPPVGLVTALILSVYTESSR